MCLWGKREKSFICSFLAFSQEIWTEENMIINKLCGGVEMVCICVHTPDDDPFKDTHCVLGLDDNGKEHVGGIICKELINFELAVYVTRKSSLASRTLWPNPTQASIQVNTFLSCLNSGNSRIVSPLWPFNFQSSRGKT